MSHNNTSKIEELRAVLQKTHPSVCNENDVVARYAFKGAMEEARFSCALIGNMIEKGLFKAGKDMNEAKVTHNDLVALQDVFGGEAIEG